MPYDFSVLRELRKKRKLTISDLSKLCGVSYVALSKLERNQGNPELRTLDRISHALGMPCHTLVTLAEQKRPMTAVERIHRVPGKVDCRFVELDGTRIVLSRVPKGGDGCDSQFHQDDHEHCFVIEGRVKVTIRGTEYLLKSGEGLAWDSQVEHAYEALDPSLFVTVLTPKHA